MKQTFAKRTWMIPLAIAGLAAAAGYGGLALLHHGEAAPDLANSMSKSRSDGVGCSVPDQVVVSGFGGPARGWSYFQTGASIAVGGSIHYLCNGQSVQGDVESLGVDISCDGMPLEISQSSGSGYSWTANFTAPTEETICSVNVEVQTEDFVTGSVDETYVFMPNPENRPFVTQILPQSGTVLYPDPISFVAEAGVAPSTAGGNPPLFEIEQVAFFAALADAPLQVTELGQVDQPPYILPARPVNPAAYQFYAVATDSRGYKAMSDWVRVDSRFNAPPKLRFIRPTIGSIYSLGDKVTVSVEASDFDLVGGPQQGLRRISVFANG